MLSLAQGAAILLGSIVMGVAGAGIVVGVMALLLDQKIELVEGVVVGSVAVGLLGASIAAVGSVWFVVLFAADVALLVAVYWQVVTARAGDPRRFIREDQRRALAAIERDYGNAAAHAFLADLYRKEGRHKEALEQYEIALTLSAALPDEQTRLRRAMELTQQEAAKTRRCPHCGDLMPQRAAACPHCGRHMAWATWLLPEHPEESRRFAITAGLSLVGFVLAELLRGRLGWWVWLGLLVWVAVMILAVMKPEEELQGPTHRRREVDARIEEEDER